jgi:hypothetical protein
VQHDPTHREGFAVTKSNREPVEGRLRQHLSAAFARRLVERRDIGRVVVDG